MAATCHILIIRLRVWSESDLPLFFPLIMTIRSSRMSFSNMIAKSLTMSLIVVSFNFFSLKSTRIRLIPFFAIYSAHCLPIPSAAPVTSAYPSPATPLKSSSFGKKCTENILHCVCKNRRRQRPPTICKNKKKQNRNKKSKEKHDKKQKKNNNPKKK